ncbi:iron-containing alcohol dehydrogenase [Rhodobacteraceae bacterium]|nr:iron-containing alcohol dehydrogenase [Paracoccaceae bacterium]
MVNLTDPQDWVFPVPIAYGPGRLSEIATHCKQAGMKNPLIVTDHGSLGLPFLTDLQVHLSKAGMASALYADISPNPRDDEVFAGKAQFLAAGHDGVIAIGGGSGMDGGKAIALVAYNEADLWAFDTRAEPPDMTNYRAFPPLITIPTTAGTGAETESTAMITNTKQMMKWCVWHPELKPAMVILDPELTIGLPAHLTAWTGIDAMVHAIEAYCIECFNPLCDGMALQGLRLVSQWLPVAVAEPENLEARGAVLTGSCLAGVAFLKGLGAVHAISHMVGAEYDTQHGLTNAVILPSVLRYNAPSIEAKVAPMAQAMGLQNTDFDAFYGRICALLDELDIPRTLTEIGASNDCAPRIAAKALKDSAAETNPRPLTQETMERLVEDALRDGR